MARTVPDDAVTINDAARTIGIGPGRLYDVVKRHPIPEYRISQYRFFSLADVRNVVETYHGKRGTQVKGAPTPAPAGTFRRSA